MVEWLENQRTVKVGDIIRVINNQMNEEFYRIGDEGIVVHVGYGDVNVDFSACGEPHCGDGVWWVGHDYYEIIKS